MKRLALALVLATPALAADVSTRYLLHDFSNGRPVGKNVPDGGPLSDKDEHAESQTKVQVGPVTGEEAYNNGTSMRVRLQIPPNPAIGYEYGGVYLGLERFDASAFDAVRFRFKSPEGVKLGFALRLIIQDDDPILGPTGYETALWWWLKDNAQWQEVVIPFARFLDKRHNSLRARRISSIAFVQDVSGTREFLLDDLEFVSTHGFFLNALDKSRPELKVVARYFDDRDFSKAASLQPLLNVQSSPRFGYLEARASVAFSQNGLVDLGDLTETTRTSLKPAWFVYPRGETGFSLIADGWKPKPANLGLKSVSLGNHVLHYSDATLFQRWFPAWTAPADSSLPLLGSARIQATHFDLFGAYADYLGTDASVAGGKVFFEPLNGHKLELIAASTGLKARDGASANAFAPVYDESLLTLHWHAGRYKERYNFDLWGGLIQTKDYYLTSDIGAPFFDVTSQRVIRNQKLLSPTERKDRGASAKLAVKGLIASGNELNFSLAWVGPDFAPLWRDYYEGGVDDLYYDLAGGSASMLQSFGPFLIGGSVSEHTAPSNFFSRRNLQSWQVGVHDPFGLHLDLSYSQSFLQQVNNINDQVRHFWDQRERTGYEIRGTFHFKPWLDLTARYREDVDQLYSNYYGVKELADRTEPRRLLVEARLNVWSNARLFAAYGKEEPFGYYTYYDQDLLENFSSLTFEATF